MNICFIAHQATKEGAGRFLLDQVDYLISKKIAVFVILPGYGPLGDVLFQRGVVFNLVNNPWWIKSRCKASEVDYRKTYESACQMVDLFQRWKIDIVYTQTIVAPAGALAASMVGKPHIWHIHEFSYNAEGIEMAISQKELGRLMDLTSNFILFNSKAVAREWDGWLPPVKTKIVKNWISPESKNSGQQSKRPDSMFKGDGFVVAIVASIVPWKRQLDAIKAVANLIEDHLNVTLLVIGPIVDREYANTIKTYVNEHSLQNRIRFLGYLENPSQIVKQVDVTVVCSKMEPFGRVTVESMACGVPVIGTDSGGTPEIIEDEVSGLLFPTGDVEALTSRLRRVINDKALLVALGLNARKRAELFNSAEREMMPVLDLLKSLLNEQNPSWPLLEFQAFGMRLKPGKIQNSSIFEAVVRLAKRIRRKVKTIYAIRKS